MARPKEFDKDEALDAAIDVFRDGGFEGASAAVLTSAMGIGRQSLYDTFGDKWGLYCAALERYAVLEIQDHLAALRSGERAIDGLCSMIGRVVLDARTPCLGLGSICEFGTVRTDLVEIRSRVGGALRAALAERVGEAQVSGDVAPGLDPRQVADFLVAQVAAIRMAGRAGASQAALDSLGALAMRAIR